VFGDDYDTPDGSCIRDYIHVHDLAGAHLRAVEYLEQGGASDAFNLGSGHGYSVLEVIHMVEKVIGGEVPYEIAPRRPGDPPRLVASPVKAQKILGWTQNPLGLADIVQSAWEWRRAHPGGYEK
jgi:UDP-glucose 4-epimerase